MNLQLKNVEIDPKSLRSTIRSLEEAIERNEKLKSLCEELLSIQEGGTAKKARRGRPPRAAAKKSSAKRGRRTRKGGPTLGEVIVKVLSSRKKPVAPVELRDLVLKAGYETASSLKNFYITVYNTAKNTPGVKKTKEGFSLAGGNAAAKPKKRAKKAAAKKATRKAAKLVGPSAKPRKGRRAKKAAKTR